MYDPEPGIKIADPGGHQHHQQGKQQGRLDSMTGLANNNNPRILFLTHVFPLFKRDFLMRHDKIFENILALKVGMCSILL